MRAVFVESTEFTEWVGEYLSDDAYAAFQQQLMTTPDRGDVMPGCGGLRKVRASDTIRRRGARGGVRIIYLYVPAVKRFYLLDIYGKGEKDDLSPSERKALSRLADEIKAVATKSRSRQ